MRNAALYTQLLRGVVGNTEDRWWDQRSSMDFDFVRGRYYLDGPTSIFPGNITRSGSALMLGPDGYESFPANTLARIDGVGAQVAPARVKLVRNNADNSAAGGIFLTNTTRESLGSGDSPAHDDYGKRITQQATPTSSCALLAAGITAAQSYSASVSLRYSGSIRYVRVVLSDNISVVNDMYVDLVTGAYAMPSVSSVTNRTARTYPEVDGWIRCEISGVFPNTVSNSQLAVMGITSFTDFTRPAGSFDMWEGNYEVGSFATPPLINSSGAAVSRPGDILSASVPVSAAGGIVGAYQMDWQAVEAAKHHINFSDGTFSNIVWIEVGTSGGPRWVGSLGGASQGVGAIASPDTRKTGLITVVFGVSENFRALRVVGDTLRTDHGKALPPGMSVGALGGSGGNTSANAFANFKKFAAELGPVDQTKFDKWFSIAQGWA